MLPAVPLLDGPSVFTTSCYLGYLTIQTCHFPSTEDDSGMTTIMTILRRAVTFTVMLQLSCNGQSSVGKMDGSFTEAKKLLTEYIIRRDTNALLESYRLLSSNDKFMKEGITEANYDFVTSLLMYLRKYDQLGDLIIASDVNIREKSLTLNLIRALKVYERDSLAAQRYIQENIDLIKEKLKTNPTDSLLYVDYFIMRTYEVGREGALSDLDSLKLVNQTFSHEFYEHVLRDVIQEYPDEYLFRKSSSFQVDDY